MTQCTANIALLRGPVPLVHLLLRQFVRCGDRTVDATCGNGKDTALLAELVGDGGHVWALDIQQAALERTAQRLAEGGLLSRVTLSATGHEQLANLVPPAIKAIVFNLGWLPGGERSIVTRPATTLPALQAALALLSPGGLLLVTCYPGHAGGDDETDVVLTWSQQLNAKEFHAWRMGQQNVSGHAPFCLVIQKTGTQHAA